MTASADLRRNERRRGTFNMREAHRVLTTWKAAAAAEGVSLSAWIRAACETRRHQEARR